MTNNSNQNGGFIPSKEWRTNLPETATVSYYCPEEATDDLVAASYQAEWEAQERGYGPCESCPADSANRNLTFSVKIVLEGRALGAKSLQTGIHSQWVSNTNDAAKAASDIIKKNGAWNDVICTDGNRGRTSGEVWRLITSHNNGNNINGEIAGSYADSE